MNPIPALTAHPTDPPGLGRLIVTCVAIMSSVVLVAVTLGALALDTAWQSSLAIGLFAAIWGGGGFGAMIGGVVYVTRNEAAEALALATVPTATRADVVS